MKEKSSAPGQYFYNYLIGLKKILGAAKREKK